MSSITFKQMPAARRTPGQYTEFNTVIANRGLTTRPIKVLIIGQRLSTGTKAEATLHQVFSGDDGRTYWGRGSMLARMIDAAFESNPYMEAYGIGLDDSGTGVAHTKTITLAGTATATGTLSVWIAGERVDVSFVADDAAADIAADLADNHLTTTARPDLPMTGVDAAEVVTVTARNQGTQGNDIDVYAEVTDGVGITVVVADVTAGENDPDLQDALDVVPSTRFDFIACGLNDATNLALLETYLDALVHPLENLGAIGVYGTSGTLSAATTLADNFAACGFLSAGWCEDSPTWNPEIAARYAAVLASQSDPALPYNHLETGIIPPRLAASNPLKSEIESALWNGVAPLVLGAGNKVRIVRAITTYTENDAGAADDALLDVTTPRTLFDVRDQVNDMLALKYPRDKNTATRRDAIRQDILVVLFALEDLERLENVEANKDGVVVEVDGSDPTRCNYKIPADIVDGLHVLAGRIDLTR